MRLAEGFFLPKDARSDHFFFSAAWGQKPSHAHDAGGKATFVNDGLMPTITLNPHHGFFEEMFAGIRVMKFFRPRGASPSLGLGLGGAPRNEQANQRPPEFAEFANAVGKGFFPFT